MDIGARISFLREQRGWTTKRLANNCGISQSFLRSVELGEKSISVDNLALICNTLNISLRDFFDVPAEHDTIDGTLQRQISGLPATRKNLFTRFFVILHVKTVICILWIGSTFPIFRICCEK